jgi:methionyl-tRNA synthetase
MLTQYFGGRIPDEAERTGNRDGTLRSVCEEARKAYSEVMDRYEIHSGIAEVFKVVRAANRHIEENAPWALMKKAGGKPEAAQVLFTVSEALRSTAVLLFPFMPRKAREIWRILGIDADISTVDLDQALTWQDSWGGISSELGELKPLFPRIEAEAVGGEGRGGKPETKLEQEGGELLDISEFKKLDLRVAHIKSATLVPGAKKLLKMSVDIGDGERQIVAGIAEHYAPEDLVGKNIVVVANLKPAKIRGVESQGMLLAASDGDNVILLVPDKEAAPGSPIS